MSTGTRLVDQKKIVPLFEGTPSSEATLWIDMKIYSHVTLVLAVQNAASGVTGSAVTVNQATNVSGAGSKALAFNNYFSGVGYNAQAATADALAQTTGVAGTFTTATTASAFQLYTIEIQDTDLDLNNLYTCVQLAIARGAGATFSAVAYCTPRFGGNFAELPSALV